MKYRVYIIYSTHTDKQQNQRLTADMANSYRFNRTATTRNYYTAR